MKGLLAIACTIAGLATAPASAAVVDFSGTPDGCFASYTEAGVTFTSTNGNLMTSQNFGNTPAGSRGLVGACTVNDIFSSITATFATPHSGSVAIDLGDLGFDEETLFLRLFDAADNLLAEATTLLGENVGGMFTLTTSASNIAYAIFGSVGGIDGSSVYADNFTFVSRQQVDEPAPLALAALGVVLLAAARRRR